MHRDIGFESVVKLESSHTCFDYHNLLRFEVVVELEDSQTPSGLWIIRIDRIKLSYTILD